jgi:hypothetical protein
MDQYQAGHYEQARAEFLALAGLGDGASQYNLAAMSFSAQGGPKDRGAGVGWMQAALENGYAGITTKELETQRAKLSDDERKVAERIVSEYGRAALLARVLPSPNFSDICADEPHANGKKMGPPSWRKAPTGLMSFRLTVGVDGSARDPELLEGASGANLPNEVQFEMITQMLLSTWIPVTRDGVATESRETLHLTANSGGLEAQSNKAIRTRLPAAKAGDTGAEYEVAMALMGSESEASRKQKKEMLLLAAQGGDARAQYLVATDYLGCADRERQAVWLRQAAERGSDAARVRLAELFLIPAATGAAIAEAQAMLEKAAHSTNYYALKHAAVLLAASDIDSLRNPAAALAAANALRAYQLEADPQLFEAIAAAEAANGSFDRAASQQAAALKSARRLHWNTQRIEERLAAYHAGNVWRGDVFAVPGSSPAH